MALPRCGAQGDGVIKGVALVLLIMSIASWCVILIRARHLWQLQKVAHASRDFWHAQSFAQGLQILSAANAQHSSRANPFRFLADEGQAALDHHSSHQDDLHGHLPLSDWLTSTLKGAIEESAETMQKGLAVLASVGSTAPFVRFIWHRLGHLPCPGWHWRQRPGRVFDCKLAGPVGEALIIDGFWSGGGYPGGTGLQRTESRQQRHYQQIKPFCLPVACLFPDRRSP